MLMHSDAELLKQYMLKRSTFSATLDLLLVKVVVNFPPWKWQHWQLFPCHSFVLELEVILLLVSMFRGLALKSGDFLAFNP